MGCLVIFLPSIVALAIVWLLFPVSPLLAIVLGVAAYALVASAVFPKGGGPGDDRYSDVGGPFNID